MKVKGLKCVSCANRFKNQFQSESEFAYVAFEDPKQESFANISLSNSSIGKSEIDIQQTMTDPTWKIDVIARKLIRNNANCLNDGEEKLKYLNFKLQNENEKLISSEWFNLNFKILESDNDFCSTRLSLNQTILPTLSITTPQPDGTSKQPKRIEVDSYVFVVSN